MAIPWPPPPRAELPARIAKTFAKILASSPTRATSCKLLVVYHGNLPGVPWLLDGFNHLDTYESPVGMMKFPINMDK